MDERDRFKKVLLFILIGFILLLYFLAALSLWARKQLLGSEIINRLPTLLPFSLPIEGIF